MCILLRKISASQVNLKFYALRISVKPPAENMSNSESFRSTSFISGFSFQQQTEGPPKVMQFSDITWLYTTAYTTVWLFCKWACGFIFKIKKLHYYYCSCYYLNNVLHTDLIQNLVKVTIKWALLKKELCFTWNGQSWITIYLMAEQ